MINEENNYNDFQKLNNFIKKITSSKDNCKCCKKCISNDCDIYIRIQQIFENGIESSTLLEKLVHDACINNMKSEVIKFLLNNEGYINNLEDDYCEKAVSEVKDNFLEFDDQFKDEGENSYKLLERVSSCLYNEEIIPDDIIEKTFNKYKTNSVKYEEYLLSISNKMDDAILKNDIDKVLSNLIILNLTYDTTNCLLKRAVEDYKSIILCYFEHNSKLIAKENIKRKQITENNKICNVDALLKDIFKK